MGRNGRFLRNSKTHYLFLINLSTKKVLHNISPEPDGHILSVLEAPKLANYLGAIFYNGDLTLWYVLQALHKTDS